MNLLPGVQRIEADASIGGAGRPIRVFCVNLVSTGGGASNIILRSGTTTSGDEFDQVDGTASLSVTKNYNGGMLFPVGCFADVGSNIDYATIIYTEEK